MSRNEKENKLQGGILLATGFIVGAALAVTYFKQRPLKPSQVLSQAKENFMSRGDIEGSWIDYDPIEYELFSEKPLVYIGGITVNEGDQVIQYQFASDIYSGDVIDQFMVKSTPIN